MAEHKYYSRISDICNECFGENYNGYQKGTFPINDSYLAWFPKLAIKKDGQMLPGSKTKSWINEMSSDERIITEYNFDESGNIIISSKLSDKDRALLNISDTMHIEMSAAMRQYMDFHRQQFYRLNTFE